MSSNKHFTVADYLLTRLKQLGLDKVFQVPGDYVAEFMDALDEFDGIEAIGDINELGAGYAADGYARLKGIGAISVQYGVGTFSALNAVAGSYVERNPVVVITASPTAADRKTIKETGVLFHHCTGKLNVDQKIYENVTVSAQILSDSRHAGRQIDKALTAAITERRPVYIEAWQDVWGQCCYKPEGRLSPEPFYNEPDSLAAMVSAAIDKIDQAKKPVVLLGIEIVRFGLQQQVMEMLDACGLPYTTTTLAKTVLDESYGKFIGTYADGASLPVTNKYVSSSDCVIALGAILTDDYLTMLSDQFADMIVVDVDDARLGYQHYQGIVLSDFIGALTKQFKQSCDYPRDVSLPLMPALAGISKKLLSEPLGYQSFFDVLWAYLNEQNLVEQTRLVLGESSSLYQSVRLVGLPQNHFLSNAAWGSLGHETGCVTGITMADPSKRSMVVAGDGGFMMMCQALSTIARNKLNSIVFVMSNGVYAIEQSFVDICAFTPNGQFAPFDILPKWNYGKLAKAYGMKGYKADNCKELYSIVKQLNDNPNQSALVEVVIPEHDLAPAMADLVESITGNTTAQCPTNN